VVEDIEMETGRPFDIIQPEKPQLEFSGTLRATHGSPVELDKFKALSEVDDNYRYGQGYDSVFGRTTYFDETGHWIAKDGKYSPSQGGRGINASKYIGADVTFEKALLVTPETMAQVKQLIGDTRPDELKDFLGNLGYDGIIIRGIDDHVEKVISEFQSANPEVVYRQDATRAEAEQWRKDVDKLHAHIAEQTGGLFDTAWRTEWQDQIITFKPEVQAKITRKFADTPTMSEVRDFLEYRDVQHPLSMDEKYQRMMDIAKSEQAPERKILFNEESSRALREVVPQDAQAKIAEVKKLEQDYNQKLDELMNQGFLDEDEVLQIREEVKAVDKNANLVETAMKAATVCMGRRG
jgi:hypothetical protein